MDSTYQSRLEDLDPQDLEAIALIYDNIRTLRRSKKNRSSTDKQLAADFDQHLQDVMSSLSQEIEAEEETGAVGGLGKGGCIVRAKVRLMEILVQKMGEY